jgi:hypothetical protein
VTFEILRRRGDQDLPIVMWEHHFEADPDGDYTATPYEASASGSAVDVTDGDLLIFRYSGQSASLPMAYVPNGDGESAGGRIPYIDLPQ